MALYLSDCLSVTSRISIESDERIEFLARELPSNYPTLCNKDIGGYLQK